MKLLAAPLRRARGVTLIEVLVTMVIVAVGLLGLAGLQVRGLSIQKDAHGRSIATQLALDIADRMRSNAGVVGNYGFTTTYGASYASPTTRCDQATPCTAAQQAAFDLDQWLVRVRGGALPGGWARIEPDAGAWKITLMWAETGLRQRGVLAATCDKATFGTPDDVECMSIRVNP
jgi:type IV pilus assembly protein PilV